MSFILRRARQRVIAKIKSNISSQLSNVRDKFQLPEKYKGTVVEKWGKYWIQLGRDYKDVFVGVGKQIIENPVRSAGYAGIGYTIFNIIEKNPSEEDYLHKLRNYNAKMVLVNESCLNPTASNYIKFIEKNYNEGILRYVNVGLFSFLWLDDFHSDLGLYKATCSYVRPQYLKFRDRIIDVGFMQRWWCLNNKMKDFDVNFN